MQKDKKEKGNDAQLEQQYQQKYEELMQVSFDGVSSDKIVEKVKSTVQDYRDFDKLGSELNLSNSKNQSQEVKKVINEKIEGKVIELNSIDKEDVANEIKNLKI